MRRVARFAPQIILLLAVLAAVFFQNSSFPVQAQGQPLFVGMQSQTPTDEVSIIQLTTPTNAVGVNVRSMSHDGKRIVFDSINDYDGSNIDSNREILLYDADLNTVIHLTTTKDIADATDANKIARRITNNTPIISGDGTKIVFTSNAALTEVPNDDGNQEVYLIDFPRTATQKSQAKITRLTDTTNNYANEFVNEIFTNYSPTINDDGTVIAFVSTRRVFNAIANGAQAFTVGRESTNANAQPTDANYTDDSGEIFTYSTATNRFTQVTLTRDAETIVNFAARGFNNFPTLSGDGRRLAFLSAFNFAGTTANKNTDFNGEIFLYNVGAATNTVTQLTETTGTAVMPVNGPMNVLPIFTRPFSRDGSRLVIESAGNFTNENADKTRELFLVNLSGAAPTFKQITNQATVDLFKNDFNFLPSINSGGTFISFGSTLNLTPASTSSVTADNADGSREVFRYDVANNRFRQLSFTGLSELVLDQRFATVPSFPDVSGNSVYFSLQSNLIAANLTLNPEAFRAVIVPVTGKNSAAPSLSNAASFVMTDVARGSIVAAFGMQLAQTTAVANDLTYELAGVRVTVAGVAAQVLFVSPGQVNFVLPNVIAVGDKVPYSINNNGLQATGEVKVTAVSPGVFSATGDGKGRGAVQCGRVSDDGLNFVFSNPPCEVGNANDARYLVLYGTGWRNASGLTVAFGDTVLTPVYAGPQSAYGGLDQINVVLPASLMGKTDAEFTVNFGTLLSNKLTVSFSDKVFETFSVSNAASYEVGTVARGSLALLTGDKLANETADGAAAGYPTELRGVRVTVGGQPARLSYISPAQINFIVPENIAAAPAVAVTVNNNGTILTGRVAVRDASPGLFTTTSNGEGRVLAKCGTPQANGTIVLSDPPCAVGTTENPNLLRVFGTGWRFASKVLININGTDLTPTFAGGQPNGSGGSLLGIDQIDVKLTPELQGKADVDVIIKTTDKDGDRSSKAGIKISFQ